MIWRLQNIEGNRDAVKSKVAAEKIPSDAKAFIASQVDALPPNTLSIGLSGYCQSVGTGRKMTRHIAIDLETFLG